MNKKVKPAAASAAKWALILSGAFILGPIIVGLAGGTGLSGKMMAEKLVVGIAWFPILFFGLWAWGVFSKKDPMTGAAIQESDNNKVPFEATDHPEEPGKEATRELSKWNYIGLGVGLFMLLFLFIPKLIAGTLEIQFYLGAAFWVGVIIYCSLNIYRAKQNTLNE